MWGRLVAWVVGLFASDVKQAADEKAQADKAESEAIHKEVQGPPKAPG